MWHQSWEILPWAISPAWVLTWWFHSLGARGQLPSGYMVSSPWFLKQFAHILPTLGAEGVLPRRQIESFLRVFKQLTHTLPSRQVVGYLSICLPLWSQLAQWASCDLIQNLPINLISICPVGKFQNWSERTHQFAHEPLYERTLGFLSQFWSKLAHHVPEPLVMSSFIICSQCTQLHAHWVLFNVFKRNSQF